MFWVSQPQETTCYLLTNLPGRIQRSIGNTFGLRTWIEYGFKQAKDELGWADYRLTDAASIERWWEIVMCELLPNVKTKAYQNIRGPSGYDFDDVARWLFYEQRWCRFACLRSGHPLIQFTTAWST